MGYSSRNWDSLQPHNNDTVLLPRKNMEQSQLGLQKANSKRISKEDEK